MSVPANRAEERESHPRPYARLYMTNMGFHDYSNAERWGEFVPITQGRVDLVHTDRLEAQIQNVLKDMTDNDYLLLSGAPLVIALATGFIYRKLGFVDTIYWDAMYGDYRYRRLTFEEKKAYVPPAQRQERENGSDTEL